MLSAQLDGEDDPADRARLDEHLAGCAGCREWLERAATVNRLTRTGVGTGPDLADRIMAALPEGAGLVASSSVTWRPTRARLVAALFIALAFVGAVQIILGLGQVGGGVTGDHVHVGVDATPGHLWHESAAWNVAIGAGYLFLALRRTRPAGLVPMLTAFVAMLLLLSVNDLSGDRVDGTRLVSHGFVIVGYLLVVTLSRVAAPTTAPPGARAGADAGSGWRARFEDQDGDGTGVPVGGRRGLRVIPGGAGPITAVAGVDRPGLGVDLPVAGIDRPVAGVARPGAVRQGAGRTRRAA